MLQFFENDRHASGPRRDHVAFRFVSQDKQPLDLNFGELARLTNRFGNVLRTPAWSTFSNGQVVALGRSGG